MCFSVVVVTREEFLEGQALSVFSVVVCEESLYCFANIAVSRRTRNAGTPPTVVILGFCDS